MFEVRGLNTGGEPGIEASGSNFVGITFYGSKGFMPVDDHGFQIFLGDKREPGESMKNTGKIDDTLPHMENFLQAVKTRQVSDLHADVQVGVTSMSLVHLANISYRLKRELKFDPATNSFVGDSEANAMRTRPSYRTPYTIPQLG